MIELVEALADRKQDQGGSGFDFAGLEVKQRVDLLALVFAGRGHR